MQLSTAVVTPNASNSADRDLPPISSEGSLSSGTLTLAQFRRIYGGDWFQRRIPDYIPHISIFKIPTADLLKLLWVVIGLGGFNDVHHRGEWRDVYQRLNKLETVPNNGPHYTKTTFLRFLAFAELEYHNVSENRNKLTDEELYDTDGKEHVDLNALKVRVDQYNQKAVNEYTYHNPSPSKSGSPSTPQNYHAQIQQQLLTSRGSVGNNDNESFVPSRPNHKYKGSHNANRMAVPKKKRTSGFAFKVDDEQSSATSSATSSPVKQRRGRPPSRFLEERHNSYGSDLESVRSRSASHEPTRRDGSNGSNGRHLSANHGQRGRQASPSARDYSHLRKKPRLDELKQRFLDIVQKNATLEESEEERTKADSSIFVSLIAPSDDQIQGPRKNTTHISSSFHHYLRSVLVCRRQTKMASAAGTSDEPLHGKIPRIA